MAAQKILIVEDDSYVRKQLKDFLIGDYEVFTAEDGTEALNIVGHTDLNAVLLDLYLPPDIRNSQTGMDVLQRIAETQSNTKVIVITGSNDKKDALTAIEMGVYDYITKPFDPDELKILIKRCLYIQGLERENRDLQKESEKKTHFQNIIGDCPQMRQILSTIKRVSPTDYTVLVEGESGTGKELVARAIHSQSPRREGPFVVINCTAIPEHLLESELFGHEKGSFTGAYTTKRGRIELAEKGSLFLDEIGDLPPSLQGKLLRFLEESKIERIGGISQIEVNTRVVAATNKNLKEAVKRGLFREDLYHRLNVIPIKLPPLRERGDDILLLADYFLNKCSKGKKLTSAAKRALFQYKWPGNVRELGNRIRGAIAVSSKNLISAEDLGLDPEDNKSLLEHAKQHLEKEYIIMALRRNNGNITHTAQELGKDRKTLRKLMQKYGISKERFIPRHKGIIKSLGRNVMSKLRVLVVEGEEAVRKALVLELQKYYEVFGAEDRDNALTYLEKGKRPDVVLLELFLPPGEDTLEDGFCVLEKFKQRIPETKIIIMTTVTKREVIDKAKELGADEYIAKPFEIEDLEGTIEEVSKFLPSGKEKREQWRDESGKAVGAEKRRYWRVSCELPIHWSLIEGESPLKGESKTINISYAGVSFPVETPIATDSLLDMELFLPSHSSELAIKATGKVRWIAKLKNEHTYRLGVEFLKMEYAHRKAIADYIYPHT